MNFIKRDQLLASTMIAGFALAAATSQATAQEASATESSQVSDIVVTGSRIARQDYVSSSPIVTVGQEDFQNTGAVTIDALVNDLPQFTPSISSTSNNPSNGGQANINLRGLGTQRTLVLMNGRRVIPSNANGVVDVNILPTALIRNIEVISGGASAAYGSDALAGVANFILDDNFSGVQFDAQYGVTDREDGETESYSLTVGGNFADDRGNMVLSVGRSTRATIFNSARDFSRISGPSGASPLGNTVFDANNLPSQALIDSYFGAPTVCPTSSDVDAPCVANTGSFGFNNDGSLFSYIGTRNFDSPGGIDYDGFATPGGDYAYNTGPLNYLQLPLERWNAYASANYKLNDAATVYGSLLFTEYEAAQELAATPAASTTGFRIPVSNPFISPDLRTLLDSRLFSDPRTEGAFSPFLYVQDRDADGELIDGSFTQQFYPDGTPVQSNLQSFRLDKRFNEVGGRRSIENYTVYQGTIGIRGDLVGLRDWTYDIYAQRGRTERITLQTGNVSRSAVQTLLDAPDGGASLCAGGFNPFGESNLSAECISYIGRSSQNVTIQEQTVVEAALQGGIWDLPAGTARFAAGIQYRQDNFSFRPDASLSRRNPTVTRPDGGTTGGSEIAGFNPSQALSGSTNSLEFFGELLVPVLADLPFAQNVDLSVGYRYSDYNTVGGVHAYKADIDWRVFDYLRFRGGYSSSVRAPSVGELFAPLNTSFPNIGGPTATGLLGDPCDIRSSYRNGPNAEQVRALCVAQGLSAGAANAYQFANNQVPGITGGNPNLEEEKSKSFNIGVVLGSPFQSPWLSGVSASVDYYNIEIEDVIGSIGASAQLQGCFNAQGQNPTYDPANGFCQLFRRDPLSGSVVDAQELNANLGSLSTSGIDAQLDWRLVLADVGAPDWGTLDFNVVLGWLENRDLQEVAGGPVIDRTGTIDSVFGNTFPEWKALTSIGWRYGDFGAGVRWRRIGEMTQFSTTNVIDATDYFDLNASWSITDSVSLRATINNVTDEQPRTYSPGVQANTDPSTYDTLGRRYSIGLTARF